MLDLERRTGSGIKAPSVNPEIYVKHARWLGGFFGVGGEVGFSSNPSRNKHENYRLYYPHLGFNDNDYDKTIAFQHLYC